MRSGPQYLPNGGHRYYVNTKALLKLEKFLLNCLVIINAVALRGEGTPLAFLNVFLL